MSTYFNQQTKRCDFRALTPADIPSWEMFFDDNPNLRYLSISDDADFKQIAHDWVMKQQDRYDAEGLGHLAIIDRETGAFVAMGGLLPREIKGKAEIEVAYSVKPKYWGMGYGTEVAQQLLKYGISNELSPRYVSMIHPENIGSQKIAQKNGMTVQFQSTYMEMAVDVYVVDV